MTSTEDLIGKVYGNSTNSTEEEAEEEQHTSSDVGHGNGNGKGRKKSSKRDELNNEKFKQKYKTYKYSNRGKGILHEAVVLAGLPRFLKYVSGEIKTVEYIEEAGRIIKPLYPEEYPYEPYEFSCMEEVREYVKRAESTSIDFLYRQAKQFVMEYNDQDTQKLILVAIDIIFSYFQDKFSTTHYLSIVGDNDSGKSSIGITFEAIGYRPVYMTDPSAANIYRCLGTIEPGQCSIILDEADKIDKSPEMISILKTGYQLNGKVPKINTNIIRQEFFCTYSLKIIIAEKSMSLIEAKGVHDRTFSFTAYAGDSAFDIKETLNPQGNFACQKRLNELLSFRKLLLIYRLIHFKDAVVDIDTGLRRRNRELVKPLLQLFYNAEPQIQEEIASTLEGFLKAKQARKENTIEAALYPMITNLVSEHDRELQASHIWGTIIGGKIIDGYYDERKPNEFQTGDYGTIYRNSMTNIICDKFGAQKKHKQKGSVLIFDTGKLVRMGKSYGSEPKIQLKIAEDGGPDDYDGSDDFSEEVITLKENHDTEVTNNSSNSLNISQGNLINNVNNTTEKHERPSNIPIKPSEPSEPSASVESTAIVSVERFFNDVADLPYQPLPEHTIEQSPCYPIISRNNNRSYFCRLHPEVKNVNLESIEHHCKYKDPDYHKSEILKLLSTKSPDNELAA